AAHGGDVAVVLGVDAAHDLHQVVDLVERHRTQRAVGGGGGEQREADEVVEVVLGLGDAGSPVGHAHRHAVEHHGGGEVVVRDVRRHLAPPEVGPRHAVEVADQQHAP